MTSRFAENTSDALERTRAELEGVLARYGATQRLSFIDDAEGRAVVQFRASGRVVRLEMTIPSTSTLTPAWGSEDAPRGSRRWTDAQRNVWVAKRAEQAARSAWRRLLLVVKAIVRDHRRGRLYDRAGIFGGHPLTGRAFRARDVEGGMPKLLGSGS